MGFAVLRQAAQHTIVNVHVGCRMQRVSGAHGQLAARIRRAGIFSNKASTARSF